MYHNNRLMSSPNPSFSSPVMMREAPEMNEFKTSRTYFPLLPIKISYTDTNSCVLMLFLVDTGSKTLTDSNSVLVLV